jgi:hypothetical protein
LELALNLVWFGFSVLLLLAGLVHVARHGERLSPALAAVALVCVACLLFPVISMTDDLNSGPAMLEPGKLKKLVQVVHVVLTLLSWNALQAPAESCWLALDRPPDTTLPLQEIFSFDLSRRPPPQTHLV